MHIVDRHRIRDADARDQDDKPENRRASRPTCRASLTAKRRGNIAILRLSRPQKRNALDDTTILGIEALLQGAAEGHQGRGDRTARASIFPPASISAN